MAVKTVQKKGSQEPDVFGATLHYLQDIPVNGGATDRVIWDDGSN